LKTASLFFFFVRKSYPAKGKGNEKRVGSQESLFESWFIQEPATLEVSVANPARGRHNCKRASDHGSDYILSFISSDFA
jgi:hypothetical protein